MRITLQIISLMVFILACGDGNNKKREESHFLGQNISKSQAIKYLPQLIEADKIIHKGILSPSLNEFYFTVSNKDFTDFNIMVIHRLGDEWSSPQTAFFNSEFDDHGMSFSPDGSYLYWSSTRPVTQEDLPATWHIWRSKKNDSGWGPFEFVDIPNMRNKLVSHPSITVDGELFFHGSELDYSNMRIYSAKLTEGGFQNAIPSFESTQDQCTPHISPKGDYLVYGEVVAHNISLMIRYRDADGYWQEATKLVEHTSNAHCQGNPYITPDEKRLFYTSSEVSADGTQGGWYIHQVDFQTITP